MAGPINFNILDGQLGQLPATIANAIVQATTHFDNPALLAEVSKGLGAAMRGISMESIPDQERLAVRGW